jgi:hypothetical protein
MAPHFKGSGASTNHYADTFLGLSRARFVVHHRETLSNLAESLKIDADHGSSYILIGGV